MTEQDQQALIELLKKNSLFEGLSDEQLLGFLPMISTLSYASGDYIMQEGETTEGLYIIKEGVVEIVKKSSDASKTQIFTRKSEDTIGEMSLVDSAPRSASVQALVPTVVVMINVKDLKTLHQQGVQTYSQVVTNLLRILVNYVRSTSEITVEAITDKKKQLKTNEGLQTELSHANRRLEMAISFALAVAMLALYCFITVLVYNSGLSFIVKLMVAAPLALVFGYFTLSIIEKKVGHMSRFGLRFNYSMRSVTESLLLSLGLIIFVTVLKWLFLVIGQQWQLWDFSFIGYKVSQASEANTILLNITIIVSFCVLAFFQELFARGILLSTIEKIFFGHYVKLIAIITSAIIFSALYTHFDYYTMALMIIPYICWGFLFTRQRSIVGVALSHAIVGLWILYFLGGIGHSGLLFSL